MTSLVQDAPISEVKRLRCPELDVLRGIAICAMIVYHLMYLLGYYAVLPQSSKGWGKLVQKPIPVLFLMISGLCFHLVMTRTDSFSGHWRRAFRPALRVALAAVAVTRVTRYAFPDGYVRFGILHLIAASWLLAVPLAGRRSALVVAAVLPLGFYAYAGVVYVWSDLWLWAGFPYPGFYSIDYFPLVPWFGVFAAGALAGTFLYPQGRRSPFAQRLAVWLMPRAAGPLAFLGRHSLAVYLLHVPLLMAAIAGATQLFNHVHGN
jgi:uncharacterized membrane protein